MFPAKYHRGNEVMIKRTLAFLILSVVLALGGLGLTAFATDNAESSTASGTAGEIVDSALHERVESLLRRDVGLTGSSFRVKAQAGVVTIGGTVPDEYSLRRALDLVSEVHGVREVRNAMEIEFPK